MTEYKALLKAIGVLGGQTATAIELNKRMTLERPLTQSHVYKWLNGGKRLPEKYAMHVEAATREKGDVVHAYQLCPVSFPKSA
jgi:hypothetical protein